MFTKARNSSGARLALVLILIIGMLKTKPTQPALAATLIVTNTSDSDPGSLRQAIANAGSGDTINFDSSLGSYSIIDLFSPLTIDKNLTIDASSLSNPLPINLRGASNIQIQNSTVTISNLIIQNGFNNGDGGAIWSNGNLTLINSTIKGSHATGNGGGIYSSGTLTIQSSALYDNEADLDGGGIYAETLGEQVRIANSTLSKNYAHQHGGGIYTKGNTIISILNSTIAENYAGTTSQMVSQGQSQVTFANSVIMCWFPGNTDCYDFVQPPSVTNSILGTKGVFYGLMDLADNGGLTKTMALYANSPLVDAGDDNICANSLVNNVDQRGMARPYGSHCDIGAYELSYLTISGNAGIDGATMNYGHSLFTVADSNGNYSIKVLPGWSGTVIPSKQGYSFNPTKKDYTDVQSNKTGQNYSATTTTYTYPGNPAATWRISIPSDGGQADGYSVEPSISADGRYVAYSSQASNIVAGDWANDIFVYDNQTGQTSAVSVHSDGTPFQANSYAPSISADGRYVAFVSFEWFGTQVVFVHDRHTGLTTGLPFDGPPAGSARPSISADGRYIAYMDNGLLDGDTNNKYDIFVYDQWITSLERVSILSNGTQANGDSMFPMISGDGRYIAFQSSATNMVNGDTNSVEDIFIHDTQTGETKRVSINSGGMQANGGSFSPSISGDGRYVAFHSMASNLVSNDTNGVEDVFVRDLQTGVTTRVSISNNGLQANQASNQAHISPNGRYVAFRSLATNLVPGDTNGVTDIFIYDRQTGQTRRISVGSNGIQANGDSPSLDSTSFSISEDGKYLAFSSDATNLVSVDTNGYSDIFVHETTCSSCINVSIGGNLKGSYELPIHESTRASFLSINNGPVKIVKMNATSIMSAERVIYNVNNTPTSFSEMMALPDSQLDNTYWMPWYNNVDLDTQLRFGNVSGTPAEVHVWIGVQEKTSGCTTTPSNVPYPYVLPAGASLRVSCPGVNNGPVKIDSNVNIVAAERVIYNVNGLPTSFTEMMGLPDSQLDNTYWMPWYNNVDLDTQLRFENVSNTPAEVHVWIGGQEKTSGCTTTPSNVPYPYVLAAGASLQVSCPGVNDGPVQIISDVNIVAAERVIYKVNNMPTSFSEMMGLPESQLDNTYWMPWYNNVDLDTQLRFGNVSNTDATVHVWIGGQEMTSGCLPSNIPYPYVLAPGASLRVSCPGVNNGPVQIISDKNIVAAERVIYNVNNTPTSFSEMMALPNSQLDNTYWMPWYNNTDLDTQLRFGVP